MLEANDAIICVLTQDPRFDARRIVLFEQRDLFELLAAALLVWPATGDGLTSRARYRVTSC